MFLERSVVAVAFLAAVGMTLSSAPAAHAQDDACVDVCGVSCVKPWTIPDRWDNFTGIPGYMGEVSGRRRNPEWRGNDQWDHEPFADANGNFLHDAGESYVDANGNGAYDEELYDPSLTGYVAHPVPGNILSPDGDRGLELVLHPSSSSGSSSPGMFLSIALPPVNKGVPNLSGDDYSANMHGCNPAIVEPGDRLQMFAGGLTGPTNQAMRDLIAQDPDAYWDSSTGGVQNSVYAISPRIVFTPVYDPRIPAAFAGQVIVVKVVAFFMEQMLGPAEVRGRLLRTQAPGGVSGAPCAAGIEGGGFIVECPVPATPASWGRVKHTYR